MEGEGGSDPHFPSWLRPCPSTLVSAGLHWWQKACLVVATQCCAKFREYKFPEAYYALQKSIMVFQGPMG